MKGPNMYTLTALLAVLAAIATAQVYDDMAAPVVNDLGDSIQLPDGYAWLQIQLKLMNVGGVTPDLSEEQWIELQALMQQDHFDRLYDLLLGGVNTPLPFDLTTVGPWGFEKTTDWWEEAFDDIDYHTLHDYADDEYYDDEYYDEDYGSGEEDYTDISEEIDDKAVAVVDNLSDSIQLPDGYAWLEIQLALMNVGGTTPDLSEEQWIELQALMQQDQFDRLCDLLLGGVTTPLPFDLTTFEDDFLWGYGETTQWEDSFNHYHNHNFHDYDDDEYNYYDEDYGSGEEDYTDISEEIEEAEEKLEQYQEAYDNLGSSEEEDYNSEELAEEIEDEEVELEEEQQEYEEDEENDLIDAEYQDEYDDEVLTEVKVLEEIDVGSEYDFEATTTSNVLQDLISRAKEPTDRKLVPRIQMHSEERDYTLLIVLPIAIAGVILVTLLAVCVCRKRSQRGDYRKCEKGDGELHVDERKVPPV